MYKIALIAITLLASCSKNQQQSGSTDSSANTSTNTGTTTTVTKSKGQKVYVHYMPWFEDKQTSGTGNWGSHWTMANQNPDIILANGQRQIASFFYPMTGPYASSDPDILDYQLLLMKYSGIDGLIVDWYGTQPTADYPLIKRNTDSLFNHAQKAGLQFAICYEDATLKTVKANLGTDTVTAAKQDMAYLQSNYFSKSNYITINNQPVLLCFGPQGMKSRANWQQAFSDLNPKPAFLPLQDHAAYAGSAATGQFAWVEANNLTNLQNVYQNNGGKTLFAASYPGFKDFYLQGGWGNNLFVIDHNGTATLQSTLAASNNIPYLQLITWNDYGEGTMIEPTNDFGFSFLQIIQQYTGVTYTDTELKLIYKWYTLRKKYKGNTTVQQQLNNAYNYLNALNTSAAATILNNLN